MSNPFQDVREALAWVERNKQSGSSDGAWGVTHVLAAEVDRLTTENATLRADIENVVWNLAGCDTFAHGYGLDEPYAENLARPALVAVHDLAVRHRALEAELAQRREAWDKLREWAEPMDNDDERESQFATSVRAQMTALATWERKNGTT